MPRRSISSSVWPFVSGTLKITKATASKQITPKIAKTVSCDIEAVINGKINPTANAPTQLNAEAVPAALPRIASGKISPTRTHVNGAHVNQ